MNVTRNTTRQSVEDQIANIIGTMPQFIVLDDQYGPNLGVLQSQQQVSEQGQETAQHNQLSHTQMRMSSLMTSLRSLKKSTPDLTLTLSWTDSFASNSTKLLRLKRGKVPQQDQHKEPDKRWRSQKVWQANEPGSRRGSEREQVEKCE